MTTTQQQPETTVAASTVDLDALVEATLAKIADGKGKVTLAEAIASVAAGEVRHATVKAEAPKPIDITEEHRTALAEIADRYGKVAPKVPRLLTATELHDIVKERETIDKIVKLLGARKDTSIREALANHLDKVAERDGLVEGVSKDGRGHYQIKQDEPVPNTDQKVSKIISEPKPVITSAAVLKAYTDGVLTREEYLSVTSLPEVPRVFDEEKARKAIKKNGAVFHKLAAIAEFPAPTTTIKVAPNNG